MSWRSCSPSWPYPPAAPVWGCPGGERGRTEKPHIRGIRLGTILLLRSKEWGVNVVHSGHEKEKKLKKRHRLKLNQRLMFFSLRQKVTMCVRHSHLYWCYLENLSLNPSTSPVNWCRGWWSFAAYFLLHWRREKEPKSKHRFCPCVKLNPPASPPLLEQHLHRHRFNSETIIAMARGGTFLSLLFPLTADALLSLVAAVWDGEWLQH